MHKISNPERSNATHQGLQGSSLRVGSMPPNNVHPKLGMLGSQISVLPSGATSTKEVPSCSPSNNSNQPNTSEMAMAVKKSEGVATQRMMTNTMQVTAGPPSSEQTITITETINMPVYKQQQGLLTNPMGVMVATQQGGPANQGGGSSEGKEYRAESKRMEMRGKFNGKTARFQTVLRFARQYNLS